MPRTFPFLIPACHFGLLLRGPCFGVEPHCLIDNDRTVYVTGIDYTNNEIEYILTHLALHCTPSLAAFTHIVTFLPIFVGSPMGNPECTSVNPLEPSRFICCIVRVSSACFSRSLAEYIQQNLTRHEPRFLPERRLHARHMHYKSGLTFNHIPFRPSRSTS